MSTLKVQKINTSPKQWTSAHGAMYTWTVLGELDGELETVQINTKKDKPGFEVGDVLEGTSEKDNYGIKFKRTQSQGSFPPRQSNFDPENQKRIVRQNALSHAVALVTARAQIIAAQGSEDSTEKALDVLKREMIIAIADTFYDYSYNGKQKEEPKE